MTSRDYAFTIAFSIFLVPYFTPIFLCSEPLRSTRVVSFENSFPFVGGTVGLLVSIVNPFRSDRRPDFPRPV